MTTPTDSQIIEWLKAKRDEAIAMSPIGAVQFRAVCDNFGGPASRLEFSCYHSTVGHGAESDDPQKAIDNFRKLCGKYTPKERAEKLRKQSAILLAEADALETQSATL